MKPPKKSIGYPDLLQEPVNAHYGEIKKCASTILPTSGQNRPKVKTNGHFTSLMQVSKEYIYGAEDIFTNEARKTRLN